MYPRLKYKWWLLAFLFVTFFLEQGTRQIYNAALPQIRADFLANGVTDTQLGMVGTVFSAVFGLSLVGSGLAADFFGRKRVLVLGTALFSLGVFGSGFAAGLGLMMFMYGVLNAVGQCCIAPPCYSLISQYHDRTRSVAMSIFQSAVYIGLILSSVFAGALAEMGAGGWRWAFWLMGGAGLVWALVMQVGMRDTPQPVAAAEDKPSMKAAFAARVKAATGMGHVVQEGRVADCGAKAVIEVTGNGPALNTALEAIAPFGRLALLGCTRDSNFTVNYYRKVHARGITLVGAHTNARPDRESSAGWWTTRDDALTFLKLLSLGRIDLKGFVEEVHPAAACPEVYARLAKGGAFPMVQFDWEDAK